MKDGFSIKDKARSFRFMPCTNIYLKQISEKYHVPETKILETLVMMIHADVITDEGRPFKHEPYTDIESFEWFLKN